MTTIPSRRAPNRLPIMIALCLGTTVSVILFAMAQGWERHHRQLEFEKLAKEHLDAVREQLDRDVEVLYAVREFYAASHSVEEDEFATFTRDALVRHPEIRALEWLPRVSQDERVAFEEALHSERRVQITEHDGTQFHQAAARPVYFPTAYVEPHDSDNERLLGFDQASQPVRGEAMEAARDAARPVATRSLQLVRVSDKHVLNRGIVIYMAIYQNGQPHEQTDDRRQHLIGFVAEALQVDRVVEAALMRRGMPSGGVHLSLLNHQPGGDVRLLTLRSGAPQEPDTEAPAIEHPSALQWATRFEVAGRTWMAVYEPDAASLTLHGYWHAWALLILGMLFTLLLAVHLTTLSLRTSQVEQLVAERTAELRAMVLEREKAEGAYQEARFQNERILKTITSILIGVDAQRVVTYWNVVAQEMFGIPSSQVMGRSLSDCGFGWDATTIVEGLEKAARSLEPVRLDDISYRRRDGTEGFLGFTVIPVKEDPATRLMFLLFGTDVTKRKQVERELARLASFPEKNPHPVVEIDEAGALTYLNPAAYETFPELKTTGSKHPILQGLPAAVTQMERERKSFIVREVPLGEVVYEQLIVAVPDSRLVRVYVREITERKQLEAQQREQAQALARVNDEMVRREKVMQSLLEDLQQSKARLEDQQVSLQAVNQRLEQLSKVKDEFVATVSHELRTPLTAIKEGISLLLDEALGGINDDQRDFLSTVDENIERLTELISNMLDLSKIEAGRLRLFRRRVLIQQLLDSAVANYKAMAGRRTLTVRAVHSPEVFADPNRILQVLGNLISNAVKFTKEDGAITLEVSAQNGHATIAVKDNGVGIEWEDMEKLFKRFSQVGEGEGRPRGTGLGLALCKDLIELHRGTIWVEAEAGKGSTFTFTLPMYAMPAVLEDSFQELVELKPSDGESVALMALDCQPLFGRFCESLGASDQELAAASREAPSMEGANATAESTRRAAAARSLQAERLERIVEFLRKHLHRGDVVLSAEPRWVLVLAITNPLGVQAIVQRLQAAIAKHAADHKIVGMHPEFRAATYPQDGDEARVLFAKVTQSAASASPMPAPTKTRR